MNFLLLVKNNVYLFVYLLNAIVAEILVSKEHGWYKVVTCIQQYVKIHMHSTTEN